MEEGNAESRNPRVACGLGSNPGGAQKQRLAANSQFPHAAGILPTLLMRTLALFLSIGLMAIGCTDPRQRAELRLLRPLRGTDPGEQLARRFFVGGVSRGGHES